MKAKNREFKSKLCLLVRLAALSAAIFVSPFQHAVSDETREASVINGQDAVAGSWPWMVTLVASAVTDSTEAQFCGGVLIGPRHVLTAAHCVSGARPSDLEVMIGQTALPFTKGTRLPILGYVVHPDINWITLEHDLAIIKLKDAVTTAPAQLALQSDAALYAPGTSAYIMGWGQKDPKLPILPVNLQEAQIPIVSDSTCLDEIGRYFKPSSMMCAGTKASSNTSEDGVGTCYGDSGGPMVVSDGSGGWKVVGIVSWGLGCANEKTRGVFAEVPAHQSFVTSYPSIAPYFITAPSVTGSAVVGQTVTCTIGQVGGDPVTTTVYSWFSGGNLIANESSATYSTRSSDEWMQINCRVEVSNSSGASSAASESVTVLPAPTPTPTPVPADLTAPTATVTSFECSSRKCSISIAASDDASGVGEVSAVAKFSYVEACGRRSTCARSKSKALKLVQKDATTWQGSLRYAQRNRQKVELTVSTKDFAGNYAAAAAVSSKRL
jgi:trypsin